MNRLVMKRLATTRRRSACPRARPVSMPTDARDRTTVTPLRSRRLVDCSGTFARAIRGVLKCIEQAPPTGSEQLTSDWPIGSGGALRVGSKCVKQQCASEAQTNPFFRWLPALVLGNLGLKEAAKGGANQMSVDQ